MSDASSERFKKRVKNINVGKKRTRTVKLKHHHAKPYRKRHYGGLAIFLVVSAVLFTWLYIYREQSKNSQTSADNFLTSTFAATPATKQPINSSYGYSLTYDARVFYGSAIDSATGDLFIGQELSTKRPYTVVRLAAGSAGIKNNQRTLTFNYYNDVEVVDKNDVNLKNLENKIAVGGVDTSFSNVTSLSSSTVIFDGVQFNQTEWKIVSKQDDITARLPVEFRTYSGAVNGQAFVIKLTYGLTSGEQRDVFKDVLATIKFGGRSQVFVPSTPAVQDKIASNRSLIDTLLFTQIASAAVPTVSNSELISSRFSPAVVKIYNVYCMDISIKNVPYLKDACKGMTGSGFFVNSNGTIATNGHVASSDPLDIIIEDAIVALVRGESKYLKYLGDLAKIDGKVLNSKTNEKEAFEYIIDKLYEIDPSIITVSNNVTNLLVGLNDKQPDIRELQKITMNNVSYTEQASIKQAKFLKKNYRVLDGIVGFKASDVALIKIAGSNYPAATLGSLSGVSQGSDILIIGYPGSAGDNGIVESTESKTTLTAGKVSAIKKVSGSASNVIETDTTIGHGNSGGPTFDTSGNVVGIATYTIDGSGDGDGTFNYIRDIKDLKDLAASASITLDSNSATQKEWEKGINLFYEARYSKAVKSFEKVKTLYPSHPKANELITASKERIAAGQDVKDFPYVIVAAAVLSVVGIVVMAFAIIRHRKASAVYGNHVASGAMQPMVQGDKPYVASYNLGNMQAAQPPMPYPSVPVLTPVPMPMQPGVPPAVDTYQTMPTAQVIAPSQDPTRVELPK